MSWMREEARVWLAALIVVALYLVAQAVTGDPQSSVNGKADIYRSME